MSGWFRTKQNQEPLPNKQPCQQFKIKADFLAGPPIKQTTDAGCRGTKRLLASWKTQRETRRQLPSRTSVSVSFEMLLKSAPPLQKKWIIQHLHGGRAQPAWRNESFKNYTRRRRSDCHYPLWGYWNVRQHRRLVRELAGGNASGLVCIPLKPSTLFLLFPSKK